ncbi:MAG: PVC-type heme-binding CxxCH protein [Gemmataceae bacterium]
MRTLPLASLAVIAAATLIAADRPSPPTHRVSLNGHTFTLPVGFTVEVAAKAPQVLRPIVADFDEQGRLYVADSSGSNAPVAEQVRTRPHRIVRLEDSDGDGVFDRQTVFADRMMFPEGVMWLDGSLYVAAPPSIWKLTDRDGDGVAEVRAEWFQGKTLTGCANDLHGPYAGPDGWIYWCKGAFAEQRYKRPGKPDFVTKASHIFRCRPDGSGLEAVMTGGMDNPVDVTFTASGERIFTTTFFQHPAGGQRDGLIHAVYGAVYGKDHAVVYDHPWTAPTLMPVLTHMGPAAPAGLTRYESAAFGADYRDNLFAVQFNLQKVSRHVLTPAGATYRSHDSDFLVSDNRDFHPTDVIEDADGSLLVVDTGGWYKLCCPTSQLVKPDVFGAIYRVRRTGAARVADPRGRTIDWSTATADHLARMLGDPRPAVARRAVAALGKQGTKAVPAIERVLRDGDVHGAERGCGPPPAWTPPRAARRCGRRWRTATTRYGRWALHAVSLHRDRDAVPVLRCCSPARRSTTGASPPRRSAASATPAACRRCSTRSPPMRIAFWIIRSPTRCWRLATPRRCARG